jgi:hypothetical protein
MTFRLLSSVEHQTIDGKLKITVSFTCQAPPPNESTKEKDTRLSLIFVYRILFTVISIQILVNEEKRTSRQSYLHPDLRLSQTPSKMIAFLILKE